MDKRKSLIKGTVLFIVVFLVTFIVFRIIWPPDAIYGAYNGFDEIPEKYQGLLVNPENTDGLSLQLSVVSTKGTMIHLNEVLVDEDGNRLQIDATNAFRKIIDKRESQNTFLYDKTLNNVEVEVSSRHDRDGEVYVYMFTSRGVSCIVYSSLEPSETESIIEGYIESMDSVSLTDLLLFHVNL